MLGQFFDQQPQMGAVDPQLKDQWMGFLQDPRNKAALLSFGLQAMTGGWGNTGQQLAQAIGAGLEGYAGSEKVLKDEQDRQAAIGREIADREDRQDHTKELMKLREKGANSSANKQAGSNRDDVVWVAAYHKSLDALRRLNENISIGAAERPDGGKEPYTTEELRMMAIEEADALIADRHARGLGGQGGAAGAGANAGPATGVGAATGAPPANGPGAAEGPSAANAAPSRKTATSPPAQSAAPAEPKVAKPPKAAGNSKSWERLQTLNKIMKDPIKMMEAQNRGLNIPQLYLETFKQFQAEQGE